MSAALDDDVGPAAQAGLGQGGVDGAGGEDRRHRQRGRATSAASVRTSTSAPRRGGGDGLGREPVERGSQAVGSRRPDPRSRRASGRAGPAGRPRDRAEQPVEVGDDRPLEPERPRAARRTAEQRRPAAELDPEVHDDPLALRIDRRVRDLGERLAEVVGDRPVEPAATGGRRVVAHAPQRLVALERHRLDVEPGALGVEAGEVAQAMIGARARASAAGRHRDVRSVVEGRPRRVVDRQPAQDPGLRLGVLEDRPAARLDEEQLARPEPAATDRLGRA